MDTIDRILDLMSKNQVTAAQLTKEITLTNGLITHWKSRKQKPSTDAIIKLANYFDVTTDYLLTGEENYTVPLISKADAELLNLFHQLSEFDQGQCMGFIRSLTMNVTPQTQSIKKILEQ